MQKICIFIDGSNLYHNLKNCWGNVLIDFKSFPNAISSEIRNRINEETNLIRTYYYTAPAKRADDPEKASLEQKFFSYLRHLPKFEVKLGRLVPRRGTWVEKEVDVTLAVDMMSLARKNIYDIGVLISDDGDFRSVLHEIKDMGKIPVYAGFSETQVLLDESDLFIDLRKEVIKKEMFLK